MNSSGQVLKAQSPQNILFKRIFPVMGLAGLMISVATNLVAWLVFKRAAAEFFSHVWWSVWFPSYLVWAVFLLMGLAGLVMKRG